MSREVRRVPLDFDWPLKKVWAGYLRPDELDGQKCVICDGGGYSAYAKRMHDRWYGYVAFDPSETGSTRLTPATPAVRAFAERNITRSPDYYGRGESAIVREAERLCGLWNSMWSHHLHQDDVDALIEANRLYDFTRTFVAGKGWQPIEPTPTVTAAQVNTWSLSGFGHDAINCSVVVGAACERAGQSDTCGDCGGHGSIERYEGQRAEADAWESTKPPTGDGWQLWETTSEGSPVSPVFADGEALAQWMSVNPCGFGGEAITLATARRWVHGPGWAPSMVGSNGRITDGINWMSGDVVDGDVVAETLAIEATTDTPGGAA
jgi:hypothetical protein